MLTDSKHLIFLQHFADVRVVQNLFSSFCITLVFMFCFVSEVVMIVIIWELDLQLHVQSVPITTKIVFYNPFHGEMYSIQQ